MKPENAPFLTLRSEREHFYVMRGKARTGGDAGSVPSAFPTPPVLRAAKRFLQASRACAEPRRALWRPAEQPAAVSGGLPDTGHPRVSLPPQSGRRPLLPLSGCPCSPTSGIAAELDRRPFLCYIEISPIRPEETQGSHSFRRRRHRFHPAGTGMGAVHGWFRCRGRAGHELLWRLSPAVSTALPGPALEFGDEDARLCGNHPIGADAAL